MPSLAIKINASPQDQEKIKHLLESVGETHKHPKFHCTIGFIENIPSKEKTTLLGEKIVAALQSHIDLQCPTYEVETAIRLFGHIVAFTPTHQSEKELKDLNAWLFQKVEEISEGLFLLDKATSPQNYIPHMTLWRAHYPDKRLQKLEEMAKTHPTYRLSEAAYVLFNQ
jgi:2'-5' RNA ligase